MRACRKTEIENVHSANCKWDDAWMMICVSSGYELNQKILFLFAHKIIKDCEEIAMNDSCLLQHDHQPLQQ
jgi:hypothetical protein